MLLPWSPFATCHVGELVGYIKYLSDTGSFEICELCQRLCIESRLCIIHKDITIETCDQFHTAIQLMCLSHREIGLAIRTLTRFKCPCIIRLWTRANQLVNIHANVEYMLSTAPKGICIRLENNRPTPIH